MYTFIFNYIFALVTALNNLFLNLKNILNSKYLDVYNPHNTSKSYLLKNIMAIHITIDVYHCNYQTFFKIHFQFFSLFTI